MLHKSLNFRPCVGDKARVSGSMIRCTQIWSFFYRIWHQNYFPNGSHSSKVKHLHSTVLPDSERKEVFLDGLRRRRPVRLCRSSLSQTLALYLPLSVFFSLSLFFLTNILSLAHSLSLYLFLQEPDTTLPPVTVAAEWPTNGSLEVNNFAMRSSLSLSLSLALSLSLSLSVSLYPSLSLARARHVNLNSKPSG